MSFTTGYLSDPAKSGAGELYGVDHTVLGSETFEDGLKVGRFAKLDGGSLDNMDGSATPVIAGVVIRTPSATVEAGDSINADLTTGGVSYAQRGLVSVSLKAGETPVIKGVVYASNAGDVNDGLAQAVVTDGVDTGAVFLEEIKTGVWLIDQK